MPTLDQLPAEQRAILELVVQRGRTYDDLADALGITPTRVRELARDALVELAPRSAGRVDSERQAQVADYLLGQQGEAEATATRAHLRRSESSRGWALSLLDSLDEMYGDNRAPTVPDGEVADERPPRRERERDRVRERGRPRDRDRDRPRERAPRERTRDRDLSPEARRAVRNRRIAAAIGTLLILGALTAGVVALLGGDDDDDKKDSEPAQAQVRLIGQIPLEATDRGGRAQGRAIIAAVGRRQEMLIEVRGLRRTGRQEAYEVWLYNSDRDAVSLGAQVTDEQGNLAGSGTLPAQLDRYRFIDVSSERIDRNAAHSGNSVLRGEIANMQAPPPTGTTGATGPQGQQPAPQGQQPAPQGQQPPPQGQQPAP